MLDHRWRHFLQRLPPVLRDPRLASVIAHAPAGNSLERRSVATAWAFHEHTEMSRADGPVRPAVEGRQNTATATTDPRRHDANPIPGPEGGERTLLPSPEPEGHAADGAGDVDREMIDTIRTGGPGVRRAAMAELIERYQHRVFGLCLRMTGDRDRAADLAQDAFVYVLTGIDGFDQKARFATWVYRVAMNVCLAHLRKEQRRQAIAPGSNRAVGSGGGGGASGEGSGVAAGSGSSSTASGGTAAESAASREPGPSARIQSDEASRRVELALLELDPTARAILVLRDIRGLEYDAIANVLGVPLGTVKSRLYRARAALREQLAGD